MEKPFKQAQLEKRRLEEIAREYKGKGYEVVIQPELNTLPEFLANYQPDIIARRGDETVFIQIKSTASLAKSDYLQMVAQKIQQHPGWRFELIVTNPKTSSEVDIGESPILSEQEILSRLEEAEGLLRTDHHVAALLLAWSAIEATLRIIALKEQISLKRPDTLFILKQLTFLAIISKIDYDFLVQSMNLRNIFIHGRKSEKLDTNFIQALLDKTRQLLQP